MFALRRIAVLLMAIVMVLAMPFSTSLCGTVGLTDGTPVEATRRDYRFDNDRLLIGGYNFNLAYANAEQVRYVKDAGIDFLVTGVNENFLDLCDEYGIGVIAAGYNLPSYYASMNDISRWENIDAAALRDHDCLWGDDLIDEPNASVFGKIQTCVEKYNEVCPDKLAYVNLFPAYANSEQLGNSPERNVPGIFDGIIHGSVGAMMKEEYAFSPLARPYALMSEAASCSREQYSRHVSDYINTIDTDYISVDIYPLDTDDGTYGGWLMNLDVLAGACRDTNRDLWVITQACGGDEGNSKRFCDTPEDIRWQMYTTLSFGAKAIIHACYGSGWWSRDSHLIDASGNRTDTYYAVKTVDAELKKFAEVYGNYVWDGAFLTNGLLAQGTESGYIYNTPEDKGCCVVTLSPVLMGAFTAKDGGSRAYTFVNMSNTARDCEAAFTATFDGAEKITVYRLGEKYVLTGNTLSLTLANEEGVFVTVE